MPTDLLKKLAIADDFDDGLQRNRVIDRVRFDKPQPNEWFKLFDLGKGIESFAKVITTTQPDANGEQQKYILSTEIGNKYAQSLKPFSRCRLAYGYTTQGIVFIWPLNYNPDYPENSWHLTAMKIAEAALDDWTQIQSDRTQKCYAHFEMQDLMRESVKDPFKNKPPITYEEAIDKASLGRVVDNEEHRLIKMIGVKK